MSLCSQVPLFRQKPSLHSDWQVIFTPSKTSVQTRLPLHTEPSSKFVLQSGSPEFILLLKFINDKTTISKKLFFFSNFFNLLNVIFKRLFGLLILR